MKPMSYMFDTGLKRQFEGFKKLLADVEHIKSIKIACAVGSNVEQSKIDEIKKIIYEILDNSINIKFEIMNTGALPDEDILIEIIDQEREDKLISVSNKTFEILKKFNTFSVGKYNKELNEFVSLFKEEDKDYSWRYNLFEKLMKEPKFKNYSEEQKIIYAMKMGALDISECIK